MASPTYVTSNCRGSQAYYPRLLPESFLCVVLAFPLGIITASIQAVTMFGGILPISILFGLIFPIVIPLIAAYGILLASWHLGRSITASAKKITSRSHAVHILSHVHEIAYMGIYGMLVISGVKPLEPEEPEVTDRSPSPLIRRRTRTHLFIHDFPEISIPVFPPTPPYSDPSYTPRRSPTCTESTDTSLSHYVPAHELSHTPLAQLSGLLDTLKEEELRIVATYIEILKRGRSSPSVECSAPRLTNFPQY